MTHSHKSLVCDQDLIDATELDVPRDSSLHSREDGRETLAGLLARAAGALETDLQAARTCIRHLAEMLGIDLRLEELAPAEHACSRGGLAPWQANRIRSYIEDHLDSSMRATDLAPIAQLSTSQFFRTFRKTFGEAPLAYIMRRRIVRAQQRMLSSQVPLVQIAMECGMCDQPHFTRVFRRIVGVSPRVWRRQFFASPARPGSSDTREQTTFHG